MWELSRERLVLKLSVGVLYGVPSVRTDTNCYVLNEITSFNRRLQNVKGPVNTKLQRWEQNTIFTQRNRRHDIECK